MAAMAAAVATGSGLRPGGMAGERLGSGWRGRRHPLVQATAEADAQLCESLVSGLPQGRRRAFCAQAGAGPQRGVQRRVGCPSRGGCPTRTSRAQFTSSDGLVLGATSFFEQLPL